MRPILVCLILASAVGTAQAQDAASPASMGPRQEPATQVSGVTVVVRRATPLTGVTVTANVCPEPDAAKYGDDPAPAVVDTYPAQGGVVVPGALVLRASFSAPMSCYWEVASESLDGDDPCQDSGAWALPGRTTWTMDCRLKPHTHYVIRFGQMGGHGFVGRSGQTASTYALSFDTSDDPPIGLDEARRLGADAVKAQPVTAYVTCSAHPDASGADCVRTPLGVR